jgi:putative hydrolase of HD superfamily
MYRMGMMSLLASDAGVDAGRCTRMALVHDVAEAIVGDITPHCNVSDEEKHQLEADAIQQIKQMLGEHTYAGAQRSCKVLGSGSATC